MVSSHHEYGTKSLIVTAALRNAISVLAKGDAAFVGVLRTARGRNGRSLVDVARIQELGSDPIAIRMTPAMRRYLFALLREAGKTPSGKGSGRGVVVVRIPARPFLRPAFKAWSRGVRQRFLRRVGRSMKLGGL